MIREPGSLATVVEREKTAYSTLEHPLSLVQFPILLKNFVIGTHHRRFTV